LQYTASKSTYEAFWRIYSAPSGRGAAFCLGGIALNRGEHINSIWLVLAAACSMALG